MFGVVDSFAPFPRRLTLTPNLKIELLVEMNSLVTHIVMKGT